jgi:cytochrome c
MWKIGVLLVLGMSCTTSAVASADLAKKSQCMSCHQLERKVVGPAFKDVAKKYAGDAKASAYLADRIKEGGKGAWGSIPMPPSKVDNTTAKTLADWVLSQ